MNTMDSECTSGCDSGWTLYFEQSILSHDDDDDDRGGNECVDEKGVQKSSKYYQEEEEEEEDLSMVSDASSGPPHFHEDDECFYNNNNNNNNNNANGCYYHHPASSSMDAAALAKNCGKRQKSRAKNQQHREVREKHSLLLDDTASSPAFNFISKNNYTHTNNNNQTSMESVLDFSQGFSANHYEGGGSAFQNHFGILNSPLSGNQLQQNQWFGGNRLGMR